MNNQVYCWVYCRASVLPGVRRGRDHTDTRDHENNGKSQNADVEHKAPPFLRPQAYSFEIRLASPRNQCRPCRIKRVAMSLRSSPSG
jgi:hypothetical protein